MKLTIDRADPDEKCSFCTKRRSWTVDSISVCGHHIGHAIVALETVAQFAQTKGKK
jgi:hypothetical protein